MVFALELIAFFTGIIFLLQLGLRLADAKTDLIGIFSESLLASLIPLGVLAYILDPAITTGVIIWSAFTPHAYNLIIWPVAALVVLRQKFGPKMLIPALMFVYGLDEILWNSIAYIRFLGNSQIMIFLTIPYWQGFFAVMVAICIVGYLIVRPRIRFDPYWIAFAAYVLIYAWVFNMPVLQPLPNGTVYQLGWELGWQVAYWLFVWFTFWPKSKMPTALGKFIERLGT